jgi:hypothetical protein
MISRVVTVIIIHHFHIPVYLSYTFSCKDHLNVEFSSSRNVID